MDFPHRRGCDITQGYYCSKPLAVEMFTDLLRDRDVLNAGIFSFGK